MGAMYGSKVAMAAMLTSTSLATPALAQTYQPMERQAPDGNGVDVISGKVTIGLKSVAIGSGDSKMTYSKGFAAGQPWDTFDVKIVNMAAGHPMLVTVFGDQRRFAGTAPNWTNADGDGGTLTSNASGYVYTSRDGTVFTFLNSLGDTTGSVKARVSTIIKPDGEVWTYHYKILSGVKRIQSVTSTLGFQLKAGYVSNSSGADFTKLNWVVAINNAVDYCAPTADSCTLTQSWPSLTFSETSSGGNTTEEIADEDLNVSRILYNILAGPTAYQPATSSSPSITYSYYGDGRVQALAKGGGTWGYSYTDSGTQRTTTVTQPLGGSKIYVSDLTQKRVLSETDELGRKTEYLYDGFGRQTRVTAEEDNYTQLTYDARGNITETRAVDKPATSLPDIVTSATFPGTCTNPKTCNKPSSMTDARGNTTNISYDANHGGVLTITATAPTAGAVQPQTRLSYTPLYAWYKNSAGAIVQAPNPVFKLTQSSECQTLASCTNGADEVRTTLVRGSSGIANNLLVTSTTAGSGNGSLAATTSVTYNIFGQPESSDGPLPGTVDRLEYWYDDLNRLTHIIHDPDGAGPIPALQHWYEYDPDGRIKTSSINGRGGQLGTGGIRFEYSYDELGRVTRKRQFTGLLSQTTTHAVTHYFYDIKGRLSCENVRMNSANFASLGTSCALGTAGNFGPDRITKYGYNNADEVTTVTAGYLSGDQRDVAAMSYSPNGLLQTLKDGENNLTTYEYDGHDRLSKTFYPAVGKGANQSSITDYEQLNYEITASGTTSETVAIYRRRDGNSFNFSYDGLNRLAAKGPPNPEPTTLYTYDNLGRLLSAAKTTGDTLSYTYDALNRNLTQTSQQGTICSSWDIGGRRTRLTYAGTCTSPTFYVDYDYDDVGRLWHIRENGAASGPGVLATFAYGAIDRRASITYGNGAITSYTYNGLGTLATQSHDFAGTADDQTATFTYNPAAQIEGVTRTNNAFSWSGAAAVNRPYTSNGLNQYSQSGTIAPTYDARGNLTSAGPTTYQYNSENRLTYASNGTMLAYDPNVRLKEVTVGTSTTRFAYDGVDLVAEYDVHNNVLRRFVFGPDLDEPLVWYEGTGTTDRRYLGGDERGSIIAVTDGNGAMYAKNSYDEHGIPATTTPGLSVTGRFGYTGQAWLPELGMYDYKNRVYSPTLGRFMQSDPIGYDDGMNMYVYVGNDPVNFTDPLGLERTCHQFKRVSFQYYDKNNNKKWDPGEPEEPGSQVTYVDTVCYGSVGGSVGGVSTAQTELERRIADERKRVEDGAYCGNLRWEALKEGAAAAIGLDVVVGVINEVDSTLKGKKRLFSWPTAKRTAKKIGGNLKSKGFAAVGIGVTWWSVKDATKGDPRCGQGVLD